MIRHSGLKNTRLGRRSYEWRGSKMERPWGRYSSDGFVMGEFRITSYHETRRRFYGTGRTENPSKEAFYRINRWVKR